MQNMSFRNWGADWHHLDCPKCGDDGYLHHEAVNIYDRDSEDSKSGMHVYSNGSTAAIKTDASMDMCPSPRRDGLTIDFSCEICGGIYRLALIQHKGKTYWYWIDIAWK